MAASEESAPKSRVVGIGLIGAGWMGGLHTMSYRRVRDHYPECKARPRLVIAADKDDARAQAAVDRLGYEQWTTDPFEVISHPDVEAVSITATNDMHRPLALAAASAGKHFWGEKPLGRFPEETAEIAAAAERAGIRTIVGFNYRHAPAVQHAHRLIAEGKLGDIRSYRGVFLVDYASHPQRALSWRFSKELAGLGVLGDLMSHTVDMAHHLVGPIEKVCADGGIEIPHRPKPADTAGTQFTVVADSALSEFGQVENEDYMSALVRFANGARGTLEVSRVRVGPHCHMAFEVSGNRGAVAWDFQRMNELQLYSSGTSGDDVGYRTVFAGPEHGDFARFQPDRAIPMGYDDLKVTEAFLFLEGVLDGCQRTPGALEAAAMAEVITAIRQSCESERWEDVESLVSLTA